MTAFNNATNNQPNANIPQHQFIISQANTGDSTGLALALNQLPIGQTSADPISISLTALMDLVLGNTQGDVLYRNGTVWTVLPPGTAGQALITGGSAANPAWGNSSLGSIASGDLLANITGSPAAPIANTLTALIDFVMGNAQGDILYRNATGWVVLTPGTAGYFLATGGVGANPSWAAGNVGTVTSVASGTGLTGGPITGSGTLSFAPIATLNLLANITGGSAVPIPNTLTAIIDAAIGNAQGDILYRNASGWVVLAPGTSGYFLQTMGSAANPQWSAGNAGTVTSVATGAGLTGGPITSNGTISFANIADADLLANTSGSPAAPVATTLTALIDYAIGNTQGDILYRNASGWVVLAPGTAGTVLTTGGAGANPAWAAAMGSIANNDILANISGISAPPIANTLTAVIDSAIGAVQGDMLYRNGTVWTVLAPGTSGQVLVTGGASANPSWADAPLVSIPSGDMLANTTGSSGFPAGVTFTSYIDFVMGNTQGDILYRNGSNWTVLGPGTAGQALITGGAGANPSWGDSAFAPISNNEILSNISGMTAAPTANALTAIIDSSMGLSQGDILYRNSSVWTVLAPGTSGLFLQTQGAGANPQWAAAGLPSIADADLLANTSGSAAMPVATTLTHLIDYAIGNTQGDILYRNASGWVVLAPGTAGFLLQTGGAGANPSWVTAPSSSTYTDTFLLMGA